MKKIKIIFLINLLSIPGVEAQIWQMEVSPTNKIGIGVSSSSNYAGIFTCLNKMAPDLVIGGNESVSFGDDCVLAADPTFVSSDLFLQANDDIILEFDKNNSSEQGKLEIKSGAGNIVYQLEEEGFSTQTGNQSVLTMKSTNHVNGSVLVLRNETPTLFNYIGAINFQSGVATPGQISYSSSNTMDFRVNGINPLMQLGGFNNDITMSSGAKLTKDGVWTDAPVTSNARSLQQSVNPVSILSALSDIPIYYWSSKIEQQTQHMSPSAEDFYQAFGCGEDDQHLAASDMAAVALAAVQALQKENQELKTRLTEQEKQIETLLMKWVRLENNMDQGKMMRFK